MYCAFLSFIPTTIYENAGLRRIFIWFMITKKLRLDDSYKTLFLWNIMSLTWVTPSMNTVLPCSLRDSSLNKLVRSVPNVLVHNSMQISRNMLSSVVTPPRNWDPTCLDHFCQDTRHQDPIISRIKDMLTHRASSLISRNCYQCDFFTFQSSNFFTFWTLQTYIH